MPTIGNIDGLAVSPGVLGNQISVNIINTHAGADFIGSVSGLAITWNLGTFTSGGNELYNLFYDQIAADANAVPSIAALATFTGEVRTPSSNIIFSPGAYFFNTGAASFGANVFSSGLITPAPAPPVTPTILGGPGRGPRRGFLLNSADLCLARDFRLLDRIDPCALSCHRKPLCVTFEEFYSGTSDGRIDHITIPNEARRFYPTATIALPTVAAGNVAVLSFLVPNGYDGFILGGFHEYVGPNFAQGSGDIAWRLRISQVYARDMGNMLVAMGSQRTLQPIEGGIWLSSNQLVQYQVQLLNLSGLLTPGIGSIICGLFGYFYPRK